MLHIKQEMQIEREMEGPLCILVSLKETPQTNEVVLEAVRKGQRSHFPLLGFHWLLESLALQAKAQLNKNISYWLLEWLARANQLINATCSRRLYEKPLVLQ